MPHAPQFVSLAWVSTQRPAHSVWPIGQVQTPATQVEPLPHAWPQAPQWSLLVAVSTQALLHAESVCGQAQTPAVQV